MTIYQVAANNINSYCEGQLYAFNRQLQTAEMSYAKVCAYLKAIEDCDLCGAGYAANIKEEFSKKLFA